MLEEVDDELRIEKNAKKKKKIKDDKNGNNNSGSDKRTQREPKETNYFSLKNKIKARILAKLIQLIETLITEPNLEVKYNPFYILQYLLVSDSLVINSYYDVPEKFMGEANISNSNKSAAEKSKDLNAINLLNSKMEKELKSNITDLLKTGLYNILIDYILKMTETLRDIEDLRSFGEFSTTGFRISINAICSILEIARRYPKLEPYKSFLNTEVLDWTNANEDDVFDNTNPDPKIDDSSTFCKLFYRLVLLLEKFNSELKLSIPISSILSLLNKLIFIAHDSVGICTREHFNLKNKKRKQHDLTLIDSLPPLDILKYMKPVDTQNNFNAFNGVVSSFGGPGGGGFGGNAGGGYNNNGNQKRVATKTRPNKCKKLVKSRDKRGIIMVPEELNPERDGGYGIGLDRPGTPMNLSEAEDNDEEDENENEKNQIENKNKDQNPIEVTKEDIENQNINKNSDDPAESEISETPTVVDREEPATETNNSPVLPMHENEEDSDSNEPNNKCTPKQGSLQKDNLSIWPPLPLDFGLWEMIISNFCVA